MFGEVRWEVEEVGEHLEVGECLAAGRRSRSMARWWGRKEGRVRREEAAREKVACRKVWIQ